MAYEKKVPDWNAAGTEPPSSLKTSGFSAGYKPPADYFNWFWHSVYEALAELQGHNKLKTYTALDQLGLTAGSETISSIVQTMVDNSMLQMSVGSGYNTSQYPKSGYGTLVVFKKNNGRTMLLYSYTNTEEFGFYYGSYYKDTSGAEKWSGWRNYLPASGGTVTGNLDFQKVDNGHGGIYKNHSATADYGMVVRDEAADGKTANISVCAAENTATFQDNAGERHKLYGEHNEDLLKTNIGHNQKLYTDLTQIGLTLGSETIETIATKLPTYSRLVLTVGSTNNLTIYPNSNYGLLVVEKTVNSRIVFTFTNNIGESWVGSYSISTSGNTWSDWRKMTNPKRVSITFSTSWTASGGNFTQTVTVTSGTANSLVALQPTVAQIVALQSAGVAALVVDNNNGTFTATAVGAKPTAAMTIQATLTEVL